MISDEPVTVLNVCLFNAKQDDRVMTKISPSFDTHHFKQYRQPIFLLSQK
jgi:hypothetical protein